VSTTRLLLHESRKQALPILGATALLELLLALVLICSDGEWPLLGGWLYVDAAARVFVAIAATVLAGVALYVWNRVRVSPRLAMGLPAFTGYVIALMGSLTLAILSNHLALTWVAIEASALFAVPLIYHHRTPESVSAAWRYHLFSTLGLGTALVGLVCLARGAELGGNEAGLFVRGVARGGAGNVWRSLGVLLVLLGYGGKLGLAPFYGWLADAYDKSPPSVTALLSAVQSSVVILAVIRVVDALGGGEPAITQNLLVGMGLASMFVSTIHIVTQTNYKRLIAYAAMTHNGIVALGLGAGRTAAYGVMLYVFSNALVKALLFLTCGAIKARYRTKEVADLRGLIKEMPVSGLCFMIGTFALLGFAPFGSFLGEVLILEGLIRKSHIAMFIIFSVLLTIVLVALGRSLFPMIWGEARRGARRDEPLASLAPNILFLALLVALGIYVPRPLDELFTQVAARLGGS
jgi:hydrogenase-4 component F